jgi:amino acid adenylation domain-containing protein
VTDKTGSDIIIFNRRTIEEREYWIKKLAGDPGISNLPLDYTDGRCRAPEFTLIDFQVPGELVENLIRLTRNSDFLLYTVLMAALKICLHKYTGSHTIVVGSPMRKADDESFKVTNALAIVDDLDDDLTFKQFLLNVRQTLLDAYARQFYRFERLVKDLSLDGVENKCPLFDVALALSSIHSALPVVNNDITVTFIKDQSRLKGQAAFNSNVFEQESISLFIEHYFNILGAALKNTEARIRDLQMLDESERQKLLIDWNDTRSNYSIGHCIHHLFEAQVTRSPEATAVTFGSERLTYEQLNKRANQLAHYLMASGVGPETLVCVCIERSLDMIVVLLGILKAGGAYVPLDPGYPKQRLAFMLEDSQARLALTQSWLVADIKQQATRIICVDQQQEVISACREDNPASSVDGENLAYMIYTSGSTGEPKGVMIPHRAICNRLMWMQEKYPLTEDDKLLQKTPISFDASIWELFVPLMSGACLVIARPGGHQDGGYLVKTIAEQGISILQLVPTMLQVLLNEKGIENCKSLKRVYSGGEALPGDVKEKYFERVGKELINLYGPTETSIDASSHECVPGKREAVVPIGRSIANARMYVLDGAGEPVAVGAVGEVHIGGAGLARGYHRRPALTSERFIPDKFSRDLGERLYKTGDLGRYTKDGSIEYLGRMDGQVKVRGYRIELGEIEAAMGEDERVSRAVVSVREDKPGDKRVVAYVEWKDETQGAVEVLRESLRQRLPDYMLPAAIVPVKQWPLTPSGKLDKKSLPAPEQTRSQMDPSFIAPRMPTETTLAAIWGEVLGMDQVGVYDNFFSFGGHSLLATQMISRVREVFQVELPLASLFENPTVAGMSVLIVQAQAEQCGDDDMEQLLRKLENMSEAEAQSMVGDQ